MEGADLPRRSSRLMAQVLSQSSQMYENELFHNPVVLLGDVEPPSTQLQFDLNRLTNYVLSGHALEEFAIEDNIPSSEFEEKVRILNKKVRWDSLRITKISGRMIFATVVMLPGTKLVKPGASMNSGQILYRVVSGTARLINYNAEKEVLSDSQLTASMSFFVTSKILYQVENTGTGNLVLKIEAHGVTSSDSSDVIGDEKKRRTS